MVELRREALLFSFPEVHRSAKLRVEFHRTTRVPDDDTTYPLPSGLGRFPLVHVDDFAENVVPSWVTHGGVILPMYRSEAMWINFEAGYCAARHARWPFAVTVAVGRINAISRRPLEETLSFWPEQDYLCIPEQPWLDGYRVADGAVRQFVATPLGAGCSLEEQGRSRQEEAPARRGPAGMATASDTAASEATASDTTASDAPASDTVELYGGIQLIVRPMRRSAFESHFPAVKSARAAAAIPQERDLVSAESPGMALSPGGLMTQELYQDPYNQGDWEEEHRSRCFVHLADSLLWREITGENPPGVPLTATEYARAGIPWFICYGEDLSPVDLSMGGQAAADAPVLHALAGGGPAAGPGTRAGMGAGLDREPVQSVVQTDRSLLPENKSVSVSHVITVGGLMPRGARGF